MARAGVLVAVVVVVWLLASARHDAARARAELARQSRITAADAAALRSQLGAAQRDRDDLAAQLAAIRGSVRDLPSRIPRPRVVIPAQTTAGRVGRPGPRGPAGPPGLSARSTGTPAAAPPSSAPAPDVTPSRPVEPAAPSRACPVRIASLEVCPR